MTNEYVVNKTDLEMIADKFREKKDDAKKVVFPNGFVSAVDDVYEAGRKSMYKLISEEFTSIKEADLYGVSKIRSFFCCGYTKLVSVELPNTVTNIGSSAFRECTNLQTVTIPDSVITAGDRVFYHCSALTGTLNLGNIDTINAHFCNGCTGLTEVVFGKNLKKINVYAFGSCSNIKIFDLTQCSAVPTLADLSAFNGISGFIVKVRDNLLSSFKSASNWSSIASQIKGKSEV